MSDVPDEERVETLLADMTVAEKAGQLTQYFYFGILDDTDAIDNGDPLPSEQGAMVEAALSRGEIGSVLFVSDPAEINRLQRLAVEGNRHRIPALFAFDVVHGLRTVFPVPIAMAASWDLELIEEAQAVAAREARASGLHWTFAPNVDIARDPRWGRIIEAAGEDPCLGSAVAAAQVRGFQGESLGATDRVVSGPKHLAAYGAAIGGRDYDEVNVSDSELWNVYLPPFRAAVDAGAANMMTAYMDLNGIPAAGNAWLVHDVLRTAFGFEGFVVSDAQAVHNLRTHGFAVDLTDAAVRALATGVDMEMAATDPAYAYLPDAVAAGLIEEAALDASVRRILHVKLRLGLLDSDPYVDERRAREVLTDPAHRATARRAAQRSAVLLRNDNATLPIDASSTRSIALLGPLADSKRDTLGPWSFAFDLAETVTIRDGITARAGGVIRVDYAPGVRPAQRPTPSIFDPHGDNRPDDPPDFDDDAEMQRALDLARDSDVTVLVLGEWQNMVGEQASRSALDLPGRQQELLEAVVATGTRTVLLVMNGRPLDLRWAAEHVPAILDIWYPGTSGGAAVAELLFGDATPGGKLPFTWPRSAGHAPLIYAHTRSHSPEEQSRRYWDEPSTPLYPFGHGLSYTDFAYSGLRLDHASIRPSETVQVAVDVMNSGPVSGDEVVQLYLHQRYGTASRPVRELKGFQRITLLPGEVRTVHFTLGPAELRYWNTAARDWVIDRSTFDVWVGGDSTADLTASFSTDA